MEDKLPPVTERLIALNSVILMMCGLGALAADSPIGYVEVHKSNIGQIAEVLHSYMLTLQAGLDAGEQQSVAVQDTRIAEVA